MSLVFAGVCAHGPGITARTERADPAQWQRLQAAYARMREAIQAARPDALVVLAPEHFANFFMNNMPAFAIGMADYYEGPIEEPDWLRVPRRRIPGNKALSRTLIDTLMQHVDLAFCEEWKFDHGIMVPLHFLLPDNDLPVIPVHVNCQEAPLPPLQRAWALGEALRKACDATDKRFAVVGTGGISHWPCTPDTGKINEAWDREFLARWARNDRAAMLDYTDAATYAEAGQGGFEIRTYIAVAAAAAQCQGEIWCYEPIPVFACGCTVGVMQLGEVAGV